MKKVISILISLCIIATSVFFADLSTFAANNTTIYSSSVTATAGSSVSVPVYIKNNTGLMGYVIEVGYDENVLTPISVTRGSVFLNGNFNDDIEGTTSTYHSFKVMWNYSSNVTENGLLFYLNFDVNSKAVNSTTIQIRYDSSDTYNENYDDIILNCSDISLPIINKTYDNLAKINLSSAEVTAGDSFSLNLGIDGNSLSAITAKVKYDAENFEFISADFSKYGAASSISNSDGVITIALSKIGNVVSANDFGKLNFKCLDYAYSGNYKFECSCEKQNNKEIALGNTAIIKVSPSESSDTAIISSEKQIINSGIKEVTVPIYISHNSGIMGYRLNFNYNSSELAIVSANGTSPYNANCYNSIGNKDGEFSCIWYDNSDVSSNGQLLELKFNIVTKGEVTSNITVSYSQLDTFNEASNDVKLQCKDIELLLNHTHKYGSWNITKAATCTEKGSQIRYCTVCDVSQIGEIAATGHNYDNGVITKQPTCTEKGVKTFTCKNDSSHKYTEDVAALGHNYTAKVVAPTCTEQGYTLHTCSRCGNSYKDTYVNAKGHNYESKVTKEATCTEDGIRTYTCKNDSSHNYTEKINKLGHNYTTKVTAPTCTEKGYTTYTCSRCGNSYVSDYVNAKGHTVVTDKAVAETCEKTGLTEGSHCSVCGVVLKAQTIVPAKGHNYDNGVITKQPTCIDKGIKTFTCKNDSSHKYTEEVAALGHNYVAKVTAPTCTERGYTTYTCSSCGNSYVSDYVNAKGHTVVTDKAVAATCETTGLTEGSHCFVCGTVLKAQATIPAIGHNYDNGVITKQPTCIDKGVKTFTCQNDYSHKYTEDIAALGHSYITKIIAPTCTEQGYTLHTCSRCDNSYKDNYVNAIGHNYESKVTKEATCTEDGEVIYICKNDSSHTYKETVKASGHAFDNGVITKTATVEETGIKTFTCSHCGEKYTEIIPKLTKAPVPTEKEADKAPVNKDIKKPNKISTTSNIKKKQMTIKFAPVSGAENYRIAYRKAGAKKWTYKWTGGKSTYVLKKLKANGLYEFKFAAYKKVNGKWQRGDWSTTSRRYFYKLTQNALKAGKKSVKVSWKRDKNASYYVIFYSTKKDMSNQKKITVKGNKTTSYTIKNLKKGKKYYVRVRAYKTKNGKNYAGELSKQKSIKTK